MTLAIPQRIVTITIQGTGTDALVVYSYVSPVTGISYVQSPTCDLLVDRASYCLFVLDYSTTQNGWAITEMTAHGQSGQLPYVPGAFHLSLLTFNPHTTHHTYRFYIHYRNTFTNAEIKIDPQEGNIPTPPH